MIIVESKRKKPETILRQYPDAILADVTSGAKDGLVKLLKKESLTKGIQVEISDENKITLNFHVIVAYGVSISAVTDNLISNVKYKVEEFTGMSVDKINIYIEGVRVID